MRNPILLALVVLAQIPACGRTSPTAATAAQPSTATIDHTVTDIDGNQVALSQYRGKALLVVNTASECGYTPQYTGLQQLYQTYRDRGLVVLGFPSNDFGGQEPGTREEIKEFARSEFKIDFPMFDKVHAKGPEIAPLYRTLTEETATDIRGEVEWNFTKFLVDPQGRVVARFSSKVEPSDPALIAAVERSLPAGG